MSRPPADRPPVTRPMPIHETGVTCERALELILKGSRPLEGERVPLDEADGRVVARAVHAQRRLPPWDNSSKDGYAVSLSDFTVLGRSSGEVVELHVAGEIAAGGEPGAELAPGTAMRIMTGAPVPRGANAVVPVEATGGPGGPGRFVPVGGRVRMLERPPAGANVRSGGEDVEKGDVVIREGAVLTPGGIALLAALGETSVEVHRRPKVALIPTGDELVEPGEEAGTEKLYSSNSYGLAAWVRRAGGVPRSLPIVPDDRLRIRAAVFEALEAHDLVVTSGGVSAGEHDYVRGVLEEAAGGIVFWKVKMRPGDPLVFARTSDLPGVGRVPTRYLFGLPGNPTSAMVTFLEFARPLLIRLAGHRDIFLPTARASLAEPVRTESGRRSFVRVRLSRDAGGGLVATPSGGQSSGLLRPLSEADALLVSGPELTDLPAGAAVIVQLLEPGSGSSAPYEV